MSFFTIILRLLVATILSGVIGIERETHDKSAGFRTHILVCIGSALFMVTSILISKEYGHLGDVDPSRIAAGVVTGVGFLGAGAVLRSGSAVHGLTTAASIWAVAAIGLAVGSGLYGAGVATTIIVLLVLFLSRAKKKIELWKTRKTRT